ncbi:hypothetical protein QBC33DRAFT_602282 [Phialemonium atrogriseum]|uniref:Zn(2)-C6 fungal-type domain-containing protein n=1 Tax=Phialemonium atrogriseum TaxID=1093897 RepID=A0AAJ0BPE5_9PEZI|nr:uncharacterized protein QBC33DRAFT_602282 [Phialemonium atrogriseum]KAK1762035.1 hypothetical protein QBC33DRAFT_602282 [Phialemonium atrogriseum]
MASSRRKSCNACVRSKRRCDLTLPICQRCLTKGAVCEYPWAVDGPISSSWETNVPATDQSTSVTRYHANVPILRHPLDGTSIDVTNFLPSNPSALSIPKPLSPGIPSLFNDLGDWIGSPYPLDLEASTSSPPSIRYALPPLPSDTAAPSDGPITTGSIFQARTEYAARRFAGQPRALAELGHTIFIHHTQQPAPCTRCANARRAARLVAAMAAAEEEAEQAVEIDLLPPVQALLVYQCVRLFGDDVGERARAERDEVRLRSWAARLRAQVRPLGGGGGGGSDGGGGWACWVREESVRRTVLAVELLTGLYAFLKQGWDQAGASILRLGFTVQVSLWEARSAAEWRAVWTQGPRLEVTIESWDCPMMEAAPEDVDDLGIIVRATFLGLDALEEWLGGKRTALVRWGLRP